MCDKGMNPTQRQERFACVPNYRSIIMIAPPASTSSITITLQEDQSLVPPAEFIRGKTATHISS